MNIKKHIFVSGATLILLLGGCQSNQSSNAPIQSDAKPPKHYTLNEVNDVLKSQILAWSRGDIDGFMEGYIKDSTVRFITGKKVKSSWLQILNDYKKGYPTKDAMGNLNFLLDEVRWLDSSAGLSQVIGRWQVVQLTKSADTLSGRFSLIFKSTHQGPRIAVDCTW